MAESNQTQRLKTGIPGVDDLMKGGVPKSKIVLLAGGPGTGKSTFGMQWLLNGIKDSNEAGLYVSLEQEPTQLIEDMKHFKEDINAAVSNGALKMIKAELYKFEALKTAIEENADAIGAKRIVIDPITVLSMYWDTPIQARKGVIEIVDLLRKINCTGFLISEIGSITEGQIDFPVEEFICDGVVCLGFERKGNVYERSFVVKKMRGSEHSTRICPLKITSEGIVVYSQEEVF